MHQVQLSDQVYDQVKRRAEEAGFKSVDEYVADVLVNDAQETEDLDLPLHTRATGPYRPSRISNHGWESRTRLKKSVGISPTPAI